MGVGIRAPLGRAARVILWRYAGAITSGAALANPRMLWQGRGPSSPARGRRENVFPPARRHSAGSGESPARMRQRPAVRGAALRPTPPPPRGVHSPGRSQARRGGVFRALPSSSPFGVPAGKPARAGPCRWPPPGLFCPLRAKARAGRPSEPRAALPAPLPLPAPIAPRTRALTKPNGGLLALIADH